MTVQEVMIDSVKMRTETIVGQVFPEFLMYFVAFINIPAVCPLGGGHFTGNLDLKLAPRGVPFCGTYRFRKHKF